ncbi:hypothetical protein ACFZA2_15620 [Microbacterium sp. NPDC007973]|uniref:hypothetical protein n=1 Tax=Microbacterium sp. NPDC007973 TaxID=3364182 RepID=UPI0036E26E59
MIRSTSSRTFLVRTAAAVLIAGAFLGAGMAPAVAAPVTSATSAVGIQMLDADGGTVQAPAPLSEWSSGGTVETSLAATTDVYKLNTTRTNGLAARAASDGAQSSIDSGLFQLRDRVPVAFTGLRASCGTDGSTSIGFDSLTVDGKDVLDSSKLAAGYTVALPSSPTWGSTKLIVGERTVDRGRVQVTALRIEAEAGWSEIWRVRLGIAACTPATSAAPALVSGVSVTAPNGAVLVAGAPRVDAEGSAQAQNVRSAGSASSATDVSVAHAADGSSTVRVGSFRQVPDTSSVGEYMWSALRVSGLGLAVAADGSSRVTFSDTGSAVFANGVWINTGTDLYTGLAPDGSARVRVHLNERVPQPDGSIVITALRYEDLTGTYPSVSLGTVRWSAVASPEPTPQPTPTPTTSLPPRYAFAVDATGPSAIAPAFVADRDAAQQTMPTAVADSRDAVASDGYAGQIALRGIDTESSAAASEVTVSDVTLYPGTALAVSLTDVHLAVTAAGTELTTGGGTVAGHRIEAGPIPANTRLTAPGRSAVVTLNAQSASGAAQTVVAVDVDDRRGLGAHVRVGVVTADAPSPAPQPDPTVPTSPLPGEPGAPVASAPSELSPGPIAQGDAAPAAAAADHLPVTGADASGAPALAVAAMGAVTAGAALVAWARRRRIRRG